MKITLVLIGLAAFLAGILSGALRLDDLPPNPVKPAPESYLIVLPGGTRCGIAESADHMAMHCDWRDPLAAPDLTKQRAFLHGRAPHGR